MGGGQLKNKESDLDSMNDQDQKGFLRNQLKFEPESYGRGKVIPVQ